jgi:hypothetical protein
MYFLSVTRNGVTIVDRKPFPDFEAALRFTAQYYRAKWGRSVLTFTTDVVNGEFLVSYATLRKIDDLDEDEVFYKEKYLAAVKHESAFEFDASYVFSIQSELSVREVDDEIEEDQSDV